MRHILFERQYLMSRLEQLQMITSLSEFASLLGYQPKALSYILYIIPDDQKYIEFGIPKTNGDVRKIKAPTKKLKLLQRRLANLLNECFEEICNKEKMKTLSHGFRRGRSIVTNAKNHEKMRYVFNVDLKDFFPSINFGRVRGFFIKNYYFNLNPNVATIIAQITCHNNELPQGSPSSPIISNLLGHLLDIKMVNLAKNFKCTYSRYADDLTFSTNNKNFPTKIAIQKEENIWTAGKLLRKEIKRLGFGLNEEKTSMQYRTVRQMVTGLVVNNRVNIKREYYKKARSMCYELYKTGQFYIDNKTQEKPENDKNMVGTLNQLEGILSFIYKIKRPYDPEKRRHNPSAITKLYRDFLFYRHFFLTEKPIIITEGKTDIIYLKTALKKLANQYNEFIETTDNDTHFKIKFLNMSKNFQDVFAISTGTSGIEHLLDIYEKSMKSFKGAGKNNPVIMLIDNDDGSKQIKSKQKIKQEDDLFYYITENLYLLFVSNRPNTAIEDLFDDATLNTKVDGKIFNRLPKIDKEKEYSKIIFARKVIVENQNTINFDGFKEIFNNIKMIIDDYKNRS
jgi:RNA-directed DNA polymerase